MRNVPDHGQTIIFDRKPAGSYCTEGEAYLVTHYGSKKNPTIDLQSVDRGSHTQEKPYAFARSAWRLA